MSSSTAAYPWNLSSYCYDLPRELIADRPSAGRSEARLLKVSRESGRFSHHRFHEILSFLNAGDVLVLNNTKVIPARLLGRRRAGAEMEMLLLKEEPRHVWEVLLKPSGKIRRGDVLLFERDGCRLEAEVLDEARQGSGMRTVKLLQNDARDRIQKIGHVPLPPYLNRRDTAEDRERYQTVFASREGAVAAPTAGLHFEKELLEALKEKGVEIFFITLHTGYGTFQPVAAEDIRCHRMFREEYEVSFETAQGINRARSEKRRVIACGTTSVRTLEAAADEGGMLRSGKGSTNLFIYPSFRFQIVDALITNFHLPQSSLLMLVSAFLGHENLTRVYRAAIEERYRFYSYGDAMIIT